MEAGCKSSPFRNDSIFAPRSASRTVRNRPLNRSAPQVLPGREARQRSLGLPGGLRSRLRAGRLCTGRLFRIRPTELLDQTAVNPDAEL